MKHKTRTKALSWLLSLALMLSLLPGMSLTAYATGDNVASVTSIGGNTTEYTAFSDALKATPHNVSFGKQHCVKMQITVENPHIFYPRAHQFRLPGRACQPESDSPART